MASLAVIAIIALMAIFAPMFSPYDYSTNDLSAINQPPSAEHWFGTDQLGRDLWARVWVGARVSLLIGLGGAIAPQIVGIFIGGISGYFGGWVDMVIMRVIDVGPLHPGAGLCDADDAPAGLRPGGHHRNHRDGRLDGGGPVYPGTDFAV